MNPERIEGERMEIVGGLANIYACDTEISSIIDDELAYAGYSIQELMNNDASFEEVFFFVPSFTDSRRARNFSTRIERLVEYFR